MPDEVALAVNGAGGDDPLSVALEVESKDIILEPPTPELAAYESFVRWLLGSSLEELTAISDTIPFTTSVLGPDDLDSTDNGLCNKANSVKSDRNARPQFESLSHAQFARAEAEGDLEAIADLISIARREFSGIDEKLLDIEEERDNSKERIALLEARIVKHLQDRDLAIAEKYTTEKQIEEAELFNSQQPQRSNSSSLLGFLRLTDRKGSTSSNYSEKDVERFQKEVADIKVATALAKTELDAYYYRLRQLEKKCAAVKFEIAQASALEDDLKANLEQLAREKKQSVAKLHQISIFSAEASARLR
uniref:Uncharacterized protein n=1 Tax=Globisporangium ultimum (strain ATCC 200006 / CBS 805.95 / DAOM BR144) TaxID=431595 RepID=K3WYE6_GLOUD